MEFKDRFRQAREAAGLTQDEVSMRLGITRSAISQWESGTTRPAMKSVPQIAEALSVSAGWLLGANGGTPEKVEAAPAIRANQGLSAEILRLRSELEDMRRERDAWRAQAEFLRQHFGGLPKG